MAAGKSSLLPAGSDSEFLMYPIPAVDEQVDLCNGQPARSLLPLAEMKEAARVAFETDDPYILQYGAVNGPAGFRKDLATFLSSRVGKEVDASDLFITTGITGSLALYLSLFGRTGDVIVAEDPSYFLALDVFRDFGATLETVGVDEDGLDVAALRAKLEAGLRPRAVYTIPIHSNPSGMTLSMERRVELTKLAEEYDFDILADEVYQLLTFPTSPPPPPPLFSSTGSDRVLSLGSFSKIAAPGLRLGWIHAGEKIRSVLASSGILDSGGGLNPVMSVIVHSLLTTSLPTHLDTIRFTLQKRATALSTALQTHLPSDFEIQTPNGGYFLWVKIPPHRTFDGDQLAAKAIEHKLKVLPGSRCGSSPDTIRAIRLSFSVYNEAELEIGAKRLAEAIQALEDED